MNTAEEFIRKKIREKYNIEGDSMLGLQKYSANGEECLRWAHEFMVESRKNEPLLGLAKTSDLIYELSARCDTGSINKGGDYRTVDEE